MISTIVGEGVASGDPTMDHSHVRDSSMGQSDQPAMSRNIRELASSLVEMMISLGDLSMKEAAASQERDAQQPPGDAANALNEDPLKVDPKDGKGSKDDPIVVDENPTSPTEDVAVKAEDSGMQAGDPKEVLLKEKDVSL